MPEPTPVGPGSRRPASASGGAVGDGARCPVPPSRAVFGTGAVLTRAEVFVACQRLADAGRALVRAGDEGAAVALGELFELLEDRLTAPVPPVAQDPVGVYSMASELTQ